MSVLWCKVTEKNGVAGVSVPENCEKQPSDSCGMRKMYIFLLIWREVRIFAASSLARLHCTSLVGLRPIPVRGKSERAVSMSRPRCRVPLRTGGGRDEKGSRCKSGTVPLLCVPLLWAQPYSMPLFLGRLSRRSGKAVALGDESEDLPRAGRFPTPRGGCSKTSLSLFFYDLFPAFCPSPSGVGCRAVCRPLGACRCLVSASVCGV